MTKKMSLTNLALAGLFAASLACSINGLGLQNEGLLSTAEAVATEALALVTEIDPDELLATAEALAPEIQSDDLRATAAALATEIQAQDLKATAEAMIEEIDTTELAATAQALGTLAAQQGGEALATSQAFATQIGAGDGEPPEDIPIVEAEKSNYFASGMLVTYTTVASYDEVLAFYQAEMAVNGWSPAGEGTLISAGAAILQYQKTDRQALITIGDIPLAGGSLVQILIQAR